MIAEIVTFDLPAGMTQAELMEKYNATVPRWRANRDLIRKTYVYDKETNRGGGIYLWKTKDAALKAHNAEWCQMAEDMYGSAPRFEYFDAMFVIDNGV
ncbi:hypothetical protein [Thalassovita sp.]|uniref:hypothetical protein n=1 Tax=Thalassovita sp. TaxID=1979401 RepID=UPI0029DE779A|nr:hypothetical protein [Thalassovita sp.]